MVLVVMIDYKLCDFNKIVVCVIWLVLVLLFPLCILFRLCSIGLLRGCITILVRSRSL